MKIHKRLSSLEKQLKTKEIGPDAVAIRFNDGEVLWNKKSYYDEKAFHSAVNLFFQGAPPTPGPRVILIRFWREIG